MKSHGLAQLPAWLLPRFLRRDYSPYQCKVSANRENYGLRARLVHLQNLLKTWVETGRNPFLHPVECRECLFDTRIPNIYVGRSGLCNMCITYKRNFRQEVLDAEVRSFIATPRQEGAPADAVVAFSGGKDSAAALYTARTGLGLDVVAVLVDNGFIPAPVIENGRALCRSLGVELVVLRIDLAPHVKAMMETGFRSGYPCYKCTDMFHEAIRRYCAERRINRVVLGRNWWRWLEPEVRSVRVVRDEATGAEIQYLSLPFALRLKEKQVLELLARIGWAPAKIHGNSTNCLLPGLVEYPIWKRIGYHPELNLLSREVIAGFLSKEEAREQLSHIVDATPALAEHLRRLLETPAGGSGTRPC